MSRIEIVTTDDQSHSLYLPELNEHYHSTHGAVQESTHVFLNAGLRQIERPSISVFEVGFGTGLNALLTLIYAVNRGISVSYTSIEKYPLSNEIYTSLNYGSQLEQGRFQKAYLQMHTSPWNQTLFIHPNFEFLKVDSDILHYDFTAEYELVYFDAFAPSKQPEMWSEKVFEPLINALKQGGIITTYAATGKVRRLWQRLGLEVEKLPGPPGKREMLRGLKPVIE